MDDALFVRCFERIGDLLCDRQRFVDRNRPPGDPVGEGWTFYELEGQCLDVRTLFEPINRCDVLVIQRGQDLRFASKASQAIGIERERLRQDLQRDVTIQPRIPRAIDLAHPAFAELGEDLVGSDLGSRGKRHPAG